MAHGIVKRIIRFPGFRLAGAISRILKAVRWHVQSLAEATGRSVAQISKEYDEEGDLGIVAASARGKQKPMFKPQPLTISGVQYLPFFPCLRSLYFR